MTIRLEVKAKGEKMKKTIGLIFLTSIILNASASFAWDETYFSSARARWKELDANGDVVSTYTVTYTSVNDYASCGTNCRRYTVYTVLPLTTYRVAHLGGWVMKIGTNAEDPYLSYDWDCLEADGDWAACTHTSGFLGDDNEQGYYALKYFSAISDYLNVNPSSYEIRIDFTYNSGVSGQRQFNFYYSPLT